jgi:LysM repeat protein
VLAGGAIVAVLILVLAGIGVVSLVTGDDEGAPATTLTPLTTPAPTVVTEPSTTAPASTHVVRSGDSLFSIAKEYGVGLSELIDANPQLSDPEDIDIGDMINIPRKAGGGRRTTTTMAAESTDPSSP